MAHTLHTHTHTMCHKYIFKNTFIIVAAKSAEIFWPLHNVCRLYNSFSLHLKLSSNVILQMKFWSIAMHHAYESLTHWWSPIDPSYQRVQSRERPENLPCPARANSASPARTHTDNRAIPGSPLCPNPWWCAVVLWSESGFFFFGFSFEQWRRKFKGVNQWFFIEQRGHTEFGSFFFLRQKSHSLKREKNEK